MPEQVRVVEMICNGTWFRDSGPAFLVNDASGEVRGVDFELGKAEMTGRLCDYRATEPVIWRPRGCTFDETDGPIDDLACFVRPVWATLEPAIFADPGAYPPARCAPGWTARTTTVRPSTVP